METNDRAAKIAAIRALPANLEAAIKGLNDQQLDTPYRAGGWTVRQVVHHLADSHMHAFARTKFLLTEERPTIKPYAQDDWAATQDVLGVDIQTSLAILRGLHARWSTLLEKLPPAAWSRKGIHPENGEISMDSILNTYSNHGVRHVGHITGLRTARGW
jgi:hypothetical protein